MANKKTVNEWLKPYRYQGNVEPKKVGSNRNSQLDAHREVVHQMVEEHPDYTLAEYCQYCEEKTGVRVSESAMCRWLKKQNLTRKKTLRLSQPWRREYWEHIREVKAENLVFLHGVITGNHEEAWQKSTRAKSL